MFLFLLWTLKLPLLFIREGVLLPVSPPICRQNCQVRFISRALGCRLNLGNFTQKLECLNHTSRSVITFGRFSVTTPKWPCCCAEHAALPSDPSGITHTGPPLPGAWVDNFPKIEPILGQKGKPRNWGLRGLSGKQAEWRVSQQQEAHLPAGAMPAGRGAVPAHSPE